MVPNLENVKEEVVESSLFEDMQDPRFLDGPVVILNRTLVNSDPNLEGSESPESQETIIPELLVEQPKRGRGRPRTRPLPDPNAIKRPRGRPPKIADPGELTLLSEFIWAVIASECIEVMRITVG